MVEPRTFTGYNSEGKAVTKPVTARNANNDINPAEVKAAIENVKKTFQDEFERIANQLSKVDVTDTIVINGQNMKNTITDTAEAFKQYGTDLTEGIEQLYENAVIVHDTLQNGYNNEAYYACNVSGVTDIR